MRWFWDLLGWIENLFTLPDSRDELVCEDCMVGYGLPHHCQAPGYCDCDDTGNHSAV